MAVDCHLFLRAAAARGVARAAACGRPRFGPTTACGGGVGSGGLAFAALLPASSTARADGTE